MKVIILNSNLTDLFTRLWSHISSSRKKQFFYLLGLTVVSAFAEILSLGAVLPFIGILTNPDRVLHYPFVVALIDLAGTPSTNELKLFLTIAFVVAAMMAGVVRLLLLWVSTRLAFATSADLSIEAYRRTLYQPYSVHVSRNSSEVVSGITTKVNSVVFGVLLPLLTLISTVVLLFAITAAMIAINPFVASVAILGFGSTYAIITVLSRRRLLINGKRIAEEQVQVVKSLQEGLGGIRDVLLDGTQEVYSDIYRRADLPMRWAEGNNHFMALSPRYVMEAIGMALISILAYAFSLQVGGISAALPVLAVLAFGAQRLLPILQQAYGAWAYVASSQARLVDILELLEQPLVSAMLGPPPEPLKFEDSIKFTNISFRYADDYPLVLNDFNCVIKKGTRVGIVGSTGSGKSTTLDILMGLLLPSEGEVQVDELAITEKNIRAWQRNIAHVPQSIFLADATVAENIAFGVPFEAIDMDRVKNSARQAQIADFIEKSPGQYGAMVGERGVRLSGGQRQRIGIARALYKQAKVLVLDEATSSLDNTTEQSLMNALNLLDRNLTVLLIAHRLTTVRKCDLIIELKDGKMVAQGTYDELLKKSSSFHQMTNVDEEFKKAVDR